MNMGTGENDLISKLIFPTLTLGFRFAFGKLFGNAAR